LAFIRITWGEREKREIGELRTCGGEIRGEREEMTNE
jgi:hypothetical protein